LLICFSFSSLFVRYRRRTLLNNPDAAGRKDLLLLRALSWCNVIEYWFSLYGDDANWLTATGEAGVVSLEIDLRLARHSLAHLASDDHSWQRSLHFAACGKWHVLFEDTAGFPSLRGYPGLSLHSGDSILVPPSRTPSGIELVYADPHAPLLSAD
jgi:hypothetical protein